MPGLFGASRKRPYLATDKPIFECSRAAMNGVAFGVGTFGKPTSGGEIGDTVSVPNV
jgi:hypothetical protein